MKNKKFKIACIFLVLLSSFCIVSCKENDGNEDIEKSVYNAPLVQGTGNIFNEEDLSKKVDNVETDSEEDLVDLETWKNHATITCGATIETEFENMDSSKITVSTVENHIVIDSSKKMTLTLKGTLNGSITIRKPDGKLKLILDGIHIASNSGAAINLQTEKRVFVVLTDNSQNSLSDSQTRSNSEEKISAALFSEEQLIFSGNGTLNVKGNYKHAVESNDYIKVVSGNINASALKDGFHGKDAVIIDGGKLRFTDILSNAIESNKGFIAINGGYIYASTTGSVLSTTYSDNDSSINPYTTINNGIIELITNSKGISSNSNITINNGHITIISGEGSLNAKDNITVNGGYHYFSDKKNALITKKNIIFNNGVSVIESKYNTDNSFLCDGTFSINGGTVVACSKINKLPEQQPTQATLILENIKQDTLLHIESANGNSIINFICRNDYSEILISAPDFNNNNNYILYNGGEIKGDCFYNIYFNETYTSGHKFCDFTLSQSVNRIDLSNI